MNETEEERRARIGCREHPVGGQVFDEVRIRTVPRFKTSNASGNEWRFCARAELLYKGQVVDGMDYGNVADAVSHLQGMAHEYEEKFTMRGGDGSQWRASRCDQEGCAEEATVTLQIKKNFCTGCGTHRESSIRTKGYRRYCERHVNRGDCSLEDANDNYEVVAYRPGEVVNAGATGKRAREEDVSRSATIFL
jgi:hypothetical protein